MKEYFRRCFISGQLLKVSVLLIYFMFRYVAEFGRGAEHPFLHAGLSAVFFYAVYRSLCGMYRHFQKDQAEALVFAISHIISLLPANLLLWLEAVQTWPGAGAPFVNLALIPAALQTTAVLLYTFLVRPVFIRQFTPASAALIDGGRQETAAGGGPETGSAASSGKFAGRINSRNDMPFRIDTVLSGDIPVKELCEKLGGSAAVVLCGVSPEKRNDIAEFCKETGKTLYYMPDMSEYSSMRAMPEFILDKPFIRADFGQEGREFQQAVKRAADLAVSVLLLIILSPLMLAVAAAIRAEDGGQVLFSQKRYTMGGRVFDILKFRTMKMNPDDDRVHPYTENDSRITRIGKVLRRYHIDELPQLINIVKGDMSLVGPRPEQVELADLYVKDVADYPERLRVRAGLTGLAQVYGRYSIEPADKLRMDLMYIENQSVLTDLKILMLTVVSIFRKDGTEGFDTQRSSEIRGSTAGPGKEEESRAADDKDNVIPAAEPAGKENGLLYKLPETAFYVLLLLFGARSIVGRTAWIRGGRHAARFMIMSEKALMAGVWLITAAVIFICVSGAVRERRGADTRLLLKKILLQPAVYSLLVILACSLSMHLLCKESMIFILLLVYLSGFANERKTAVLLSGVFTSGVIFVTGTWLLGLSKDFIVTFSYGVCHSFGFVNPNSMGFYIFSAFLFLWYLCGNRYKPGFAAAGAALSVLCFVTCGCRTAAILILFLAVCGIWMKELPERSCSRAARAAAALMPVIMFLLSAAAGITLYPLDDKIHSNFIVRVVDCVYAYKDAGLSLFPQSFDGFERFYYFDNGYFYWLFCSGILASAAFLVPVLYFNFKAAGKCRRVINVLIFCAAVYYSMERLSLVFLFVAVAFAGVYRNDDLTAGCMVSGK